MPHTYSGVCPEQSAECGALSVNAPSYGVFETPGPIPIHLHTMKTPISAARWILITLPVIWLSLFVLFSAQKPTLPYDFLVNWPLPFVGALAALVGNSVPVGGGIIYLPVLVLLGSHVRIGVAFSVLTMSIGNGIFGFLSWLNKDPSFFVWESFLFTLPSAWLGLSIVTFFPLFTEKQCLFLFSVFALFVSIFVFLLARNESNQNLFPTPLIYSDQPQQFEKRFTPNKIKAYLIVALFSFFSGFILVGHVGIGNAMTTFLTLSVFGRVDIRSAMATGIVTGGWTSVLPSLLHIIWMKDAPIEQVFFVLPGVFIGANIGPRIHGLFGLRNVLYGFSVLLTVISATMLRTAVLSN